MLQTQTVKPNTYDLLNRLSQEDNLKGFKLVGGTALSLQLGHRISTDLAFFSNSDFDVTKVVGMLDSYVKVDLPTQRKNLLMGFIENVKVGFAAHKYQWLRLGIDHNNIQIASLEDIASMKLAAILSRAKKRDFIDLAAILKVKPLHELLRNFSLKYKQENTIHVIKALTYFKEADDDKGPLKILNKSLEWEQSKKIIQNSVRSLNKNRGISMGM